MYKLQTYTEFDNSDIVIALECHLKYVSSKDFSFNINLMSRHVHSHSAHINP